MDAQTIMQLVGSLGFPIVCCGALFWQQNKVMKETAEMIIKSVSALSNTITENTKATTTLVTTVEVLAKDGDTHG